MSIRGVVVGSVLSSMVVAGSGGAGGGVAAKPFRPLPLGLDIEIKPDPSMPAQMVARVRLKDIKTGNVFAEPYVTFKKGETGRLVQSIHGLPELRYQGWAELEMTVGVTADGQEATYTATTSVGLSEKESLQESHSATVRLSN
jgi:hypothetical protein